MVSEYYNSSSIDYWQEVSNSQSNCQQFTFVSAIFLLTRLEVFRPEGQGDPVVVDELFDDSAHRIVGGVRREGNGVRRVGVTEERCIGKQFF